ncbi:hypothetical protein HGRIS_010988 [Hohenbuehelia grisea]|uniref:Uncharacterized protein n=1 Tax=Hohenbuehelia grisea TaxID=104357 RepID=A0ABR3IYT7_9AGAR
MSPPQSSSFFLPPSLSILTRVAGDSAQDSATTPVVQDVQEPGERTSKFLSFSSLSTGATEYVDALSASQTSLDQDIADEDLMKLFDAAIVNLLPKPTEIISRDFACPSSLKARPPIPAPAMGPTTSALSFTQRKPSVPPPSRLRKSSELQNMTDEELMKMFDTAVLKMAKKPEVGEKANGSNATVKDMAPPLIMRAGARRVNNKNIDIVKGREQRRALPSPLANVIYNSSIAQEAHQNALQLTKSTKALIEEAGNAVCTDRQQRPDKDSRKWAVDEDTPYAVLAHAHLDCSETATAFYPADETRVVLEFSKRLPCNVVVRAVPDVQDDSSEPLAHAIEPSTTTDTTRTRTIMFVPKAERRAAAEARAKGQAGLRWRSLGVLKSIFGIARVPAPTPAASNSADAATSTPTGTAMTMPTVTLHPGIPAHDVLARIVGLGVPAQRTCVVMTPKCFLGMCGVAGCGGGGGRAGQGFG